MKTFISAGTPMMKAKSETTTKTDKTVLLLHGIGGYAGIHWQKWLHDELKSRGYHIIMPSLPDADHPDRSTWLKVVTELVKPIEPSKLIIVGHSLGVLTALDLIENSYTPVHQLISVSGFTDDYGAELNSYFTKEMLTDFDKIRRNCQHFAVLYGDNDPYVPQISLRLLAADLLVKPVIIKNGGHLNTDSGFTKFPELLTLLLDKT